MARRPNPGLVKIHRNYSVEEIARLLTSHKNTVRSWLKSGLCPIDGRRPTLVHGQELRRFLRLKRISGKQKCLPGQIYCVGCRLPKTPAGNMADYLPLTPTSGNLRGICPSCDSLIFRRVRYAELGVVAAGLDIQIMQAGPRIRGRG